MEEYEHNCFTKKSIIYAYNLVNAVVYRLLAIQQQVTDVKEERHQHSSAGIFFLEKVQ